MKNIKYKVTENCIICGETSNVYGGGYLLRDEEQVKTGFCCLEHAKSFPTSNTTCRGIYKEEYGVKEIILNL